MRADPVTNGVADICDVPMGELPLNADARDMVNVILDSPGGRVAAFNSSI